MLPVQVKVLSSSSCTLSEASALLHRFLSSDACSDSFGRDYVASVAQALQDSISRRAGGLESKGKHRHFSASSQLSSLSSKELVVGKQSSIVAENPAPSSHGSKLHRDGKQSALVAKNVDPSGLGVTHTQGKQRLLVADDIGQDADADAAKEIGLATISADNVSRRHKKKRRHSAVDSGLETVPPVTLETEDSALTHHDKKRRKKEKHERETEFIGTEDSVPDNQRNHGKKKRKDEQERETESLETKDPALDNEKPHDKKRRKRERQGRDAEDMDASNYGGPPTSLSGNEILDMMSAVKGKKKADAENIDANKAFEVGFSITPSFSKVEEHTESSKKKRKKKKAGFLATPDKVPFSEKDGEDADLETSPVEFESFTSGEKKKKKKKRRRKEEELGELVRQGSG